MIALMVQRVRRARLIDEIVVAIPDLKSNDPLAHHLAEGGVSVYRGDEQDVLARYTDAARVAGADIVVRLTGDCPLIDWQLIDRCVEPVLAGDVPLAVTSVRFPDGLDVEVFSQRLLEKSNREASRSEDREHVTPLMKREFSNRTRVVEPAKNLQDVRITLDEPEDLAVIRGVLEKVGRMALHEEIDRLAMEQPELFLANSHLKRNEGSALDSGQKMWRRAQKVIAGGNMLLSKRPDMHLPDKWPTYFSRAKGCRVWDLDGREYIDMGYMGIGTNILGYGHPKVDEAVKKVIESGNMSTLNAPEEVLLAEKLIELHPWAEMARFTRSGGEAGAVAVRLARAATGRDRVVFCGYHGWHDWYLAANLADDSNLDGHLLAGLSPAGVPRALKGTSVPFRYNDLESFREAIAHGDVAAIVMEVERSMPPAPGFLEEIRKTATEIGAVLVFDECTSGFRKVVGGHHLTVGINPDVAIFGKTLGNGYAINAVIGVEPVMSAIKETFVSSTFWTERIGSAAAIATLEEMEASQAPQQVDALGRRLRQIWTDAARQHGLEISFSGLPALSLSVITGADPATFNQALTEGFLEEGFLSGHATYVSVAHEGIMQEQFNESLGNVLSKVRLLADQAESSTPENKRAHPGFQRLN